MSRQLPSGRLAGGEWAARGDPTSTVAGSGAGVDHGGGATPLACVFCKAPIPGHAKTRLAAGIGPDAAAALAAAMLLDVVHSLRAGGVRVLAAAAGPEDVGAVSAILPAGVRVMAQPSGDLGARMGAVMSDLLGEGRGPVAIVGADALLLRPEHLRRSGRALADGADVAICPARDGGYSLIATKTATPRLFEDVPWGTPQVTSTTRARASAARLRLAEVGPVDDVDTPEDLARVAASIELAGGVVAPRSRHALRTLTRVGRAGSASSPGWPVG